ncbi:hypothetical protein IW261DRAFT_1522871, partial [Armillaria novae-zelandiae]
ASVQDCLGPWMTRYRQWDGRIRIERWLSHSLGNEVCAVTSYSVTEQHGPGGRSRREKRRSIPGEQPCLCADTAWNDKADGPGRVYVEAGGRIIVTVDQSLTPHRDKENWGEGLLRISRHGGRFHSERTFILCGTFRFHPNINTKASLVEQHNSVSTQCIMLPCDAFVDHALNVVYRFLVFTIHTKAHCNSTTSSVSSPLAPQP